MRERGPGAKPAITLEVLPAGYGDCLLVTCPVPGGVTRLLVDTGPDETWPALRDRLAEVPEEDGRRRVDLAVVTHIDHDHIGAARDLFSDGRLRLSFGDVWFNARRHLVRGAEEGESLSAILSTRRRRLPWNEAFDGGPVATPGEGRFVEVPPRPGHPRLTLLSPTPRRLVRLAAVWDEELERLRRRESNTPEGVERATAFPDLDALAAHAPRPDRAAPNGSSIAFLLEHRGASVLLAADAFPAVLGPAVRALARHRGVEPPLRVDVLKLSHHGSRANLVDLLDAVQARHYVVSTDNTRFGHPNDDALARVVLHGGERPVLWFNHDTERNRRWGARDLQRRYSFATRFPRKGEAGITLELPARRPARRAPAGAAGAV